MATIYTAHATATGGREGTAKTDDGKIAVALSKPGSDGAGTNPEQLFACGYGACFGGAVGFLAQQKKLDVGPVEVKVDIMLNKDDNGFTLGAALDVSLPSLDHAAAVELVKEAHAFCPYSRATKGNIDVSLKVNGQDITA